MDKQSVSIGMVGNVDERDGLWQVKSIGKGWLTVINDAGDELNVRPKAFTQVNGASLGAESQETFIKDGVLVDADGNPVDVSDEPEAGDEGDAPDTSVSMYPLRRRKAEGAYETLKLDDGRKTLCNPTWVAELHQFAGDADAAVAYCERQMGLEPGTLATRYASLNAGQRRMNAGNRLRQYRIQEQMFLAVAAEYGMELDEVRAVWERIGKKPTEKKLRALIIADMNEAKAGTEESTEA